MKKGRTLGFCARGFPLRLGFLLAPRVKQTQIKEARRENAKNPALILLHACYTYVREVSSVSFWFSLGNSSNPRCEANSWNEQSLSVAKIYSLFSQALDQTKPNLTGWLISFLVLSDEYVWGNPSSQSCKIKRHLKPLVLSHFGQTKKQIKVK